MDQTTVGDQYGEVVCCVTKVQRSREFVIARDWAGYMCGLKGAKAVALALATSNLEKLHLESAVQVHAFKTLCSHDLRGVG